MRRLTGLGVKTNARIRFEPKPEIADSIRGFLK
jgi:hypothetical protein